MSIIKKFDNKISFDAINEIKSSNEYESRVTLKDLNEDCICDIVRWLPLKNKIGVERVCRKWRRAVIINLEDQEEVVLRDYHKHDENKSSYFNEINLHQHKLKNQNLRFALKRMTGIESIHFVNLKPEPSQFWTYFDLYQPVKYLKYTNCVFSSADDKSWEQVKESYPFKILVFAEFENCELESDFITMLISKASQSLKKLSFRECNLDDLKNPFSILPDNLEILELDNLWDIFESEFEEKKSDWIAAHGIKQLKIGAASLEVVTFFFRIMPAIESFAFEFVPSIDNNNEIKEGDLKVFKNLKSLSIKSTCWWALIFNDEVELLEKMESLSLCGAVTGPLELEELCEKMPNVSKLVLDCKVECEDQHENEDDDITDEFYQESPKDGKWLRANDPCQQIFLRPLSKLGKLRCLEVHGVNEEFLSKLINEDLSGLRHLTVGNARDKNLIEAFVEAARKKPKEAFSLHLKGGLRDEDICHIDFPRNLLKFHLGVNTERQERGYYLIGESYENDSSDSDSDDDDYFDYENVYDNCSFAGPRVRTFIIDCFHDSD